MYWLEEYFHLKENLSFEVTASGVLTYYKIQPNSKGIIPGWWIVPPDLGKLGALSILSLMQYSCRLC